MITPISNTAIKRRCAGIKPDGVACGSAPMIDAEYCMWHSPEHAEKARAARSLGGRRKRKEHVLEINYDLIGLTSVSGIRRILEIALIDTLGLENSNARSRTLVSIARTSHDILKTSDLERRLEELETIMRTRAAS